MLPDATGPLNASVTSVNARVLEAMVAFAPAVNVKAGPEKITSRPETSAVTGLVRSRFTAAPMWLGAGRQLAFGVVAIAATYLAGKLIGTVV